MSLRSLFSRPPPCCASAPLRLCAPSQLPLSTCSRISHRFMRLANSAFVSPRQPVASLRQALMLLGTVQVRRWAMLVALAQLPDRPHVLLNTALVRARMAELMALASDPGAGSSKEPHPFNSTQAGGEIEVVA